LKASRAHFLPSTTEGHGALGRIQQEGWTVAGKFEIKKSKNGQYYFVLKAGNGEIIAQSEQYKSKASALNGIESVKTNAPGAKVEDETGE
jgi:uncharacterized protein YegP (UPF0339 family)